ncbi:MAG TPA: H-type small acid-soluble spore protein [Firmicutes bacterium]|nr:H-type small acid-soluble spore protein [Bacillota bacterium]
MDIKRAKQIMESDGVITVHYGESPVWIEQIHEQEASAEITDLETEERLVVPVDLLSEDNPGVH